MACNMLLAHIKTAETVYGHMVLPGPIRVGMPSFRHNGCKKRALQACSYKGGGRNMLSAPKYRQALATYRLLSMFTEDWFTRPTVQRTGAHVARSIDAQASGYL